MKKLLLAALAASPLIASADCMIELQYQGTVLGQNVFTAPACRDAMRDCKRAEKSYERNHSLTELSCVKIDDIDGPRDPNPYPPTDPNPPGGGYNPPGPVDPLPPNGNPGPLPPFPAEIVTVTGKIESTSFTFTGNGPAQIYNSCLDFVESSYLGSVDEIRVSVNGHRYQRLTTRGYWGSPEAICDQVESQVTPDRMYPVRPNYEPIQVKGWVEGSNINYSAQSLEEVYNTCVETLDSMYLGSVDELMISVGGREYQRKTTTGYWSNNESICDQVDQIAIDSMATPVRYEPVSAVGRIESSADFNFFAESKDDLYNQCVEFVKSSYLGSVDEVYVSINNGRRQRYTTTGYWSSATAICDAVTTELR